MRHENRAFHRNCHPVNYIHAFVKRQKVKQHIRHPKEMVTHQNARTFRKPFHTQLQLPAQRENTSLKICFQSAMRVLKVNFRLACKFPVLLRKYRSYYNNNKDFQKTYFYPQVQVSDFYYAFFTQSLYNNTQWKDFCSMGRQFPLGLLNKKQAVDLC